ncbi:hypothetical protein [Stenotrophomonas forensis]|uniref:hypothetical protein n=1 Tax=Stenotrophomonas forensis TaxID=2871169 RepID=UPI0039C61FFD
MSRSVVIYGPRVCGKNTNPQELREHFGLQAVIEDWHGRSSYPLDNTLVLTDNPDAVADTSSKLMHHGSAMAPSPLMNWCPSPQPAGFDDWSGSGGRAETKKPRL